MPATQTSITASGNTAATAFTSALDGADGVQLNVEDNTRLRVYVNDAVAFDATVGVSQNPAHAAFMAALWSQGLERAYIDRDGKITVTDTDVDGLGIASNNGEDPLFTPEDATYRVLRALAAPLNWARGRQLFINAVGIAHDGFLTDMGAAA